VVPRLTGLEILAGGIAGGGGLAHREGSQAGFLNELMSGLGGSEKRTREGLLLGRLHVVNVVDPESGATGRSARHVVHPTALVNERRGSPANARTEAKSSSVSGWGTR